MTDTNPPPPPAGWKLDADGWYWRASRATDPALRGRFDLGFNDSTYPDLPPEHKVFVRTPDIARAIDAGRLPTSKE